MQKTMVGGGGVKWSLGKKMKKGGKLHEKMGERPKKCIFLGNGRWGKK